MNLVETYVRSYTSIQRENNAQRELKRRNEWEENVSKHHGTMVERLGTPLCAEIELDVPSYADEYNHRFPCKIFNLPCALTVLRQYASKPATLRFNTSVDEKEIRSDLRPGDAIGYALYVLKEQIDKILRPLAIRERVWYPYYYYKLTYAGLCHDGEDYCVDTYTADVVSEEPDENGWYYVLDFAYASDERHARPTKFANVVKVERRLAKEPDRSRDRSIRIKDEESGDVYKVYSPRGGVEEA